MASRTTELTPALFYVASLRDGGRGVVHGNYGNTTVSLYGSLDDVEYVLIKTFNADALTEVALVPYMAAHAGTAATVSKATIAAAGAASFGTTKIYINETR
jgi:hypothetical protein